ncbi:response regulator receiver protein [Candidatus Koribacter versatilis Ellin345]|uniref:Response regulator receiver protein n=1 Tax=Koribacter versatilis (strain Ellin345) TaxID=204669 RepID=Q1IJ88_KORVE|nr:response regulator transcription factor [Candidatus Koribacter versatilis]ABF43062.1 response regulator receiver protein [Candidatus Koribacter versatilis Ellin345]
MKARVLVVDDNKQFLESIADLLGPHFEVVGFASNGLDAISEYRRLRPDLVVLDVSMPVLDGFAAARELAKSEQDVRIVFLSVEYSADLRDLARNTGVLGCVSKLRMYQDLVTAAKLVLEGREFCSPIPA